jgi:hypothetical protein
MKQVLLKKDFITFQIIQSNITTEFFTSNPLAVQCQSLNQCYLQNLATYKGLGLYRRSAPTFWAQPY